MKQKLDSFLYFLRQADGASSKIRLTTVLILNLLFPFVFRRFPYVLEIKFKRFYLIFRVGQGELSPYREIAAAFSSTIVFPSPSTNGWTMIDCGANIGIFSLFLKNPKRIIAVEPNPDSCHRLVCNFKKNNVRGVVIRKAVSATACRMKMKLDSHNTVLAKVATNGNLSVEATTIDDIIAENAIEVVDLLKLDLEGHEVEALRGAKDSLTKGMIRRIYAEYNDDTSLKRLDEYLCGLRYERTAITGYNALYELQL